MAILNLIRFPNLLIVALTQYLLQYVVISPTFKASGIEKSLDDFHFFLLVITTITITISGYIINDVLDYETDLINKPEKVIVNKFISAKNALMLYHLNNFFGLIISVYLAYHIQNIPLVLIYPGAVCLLFLYSKYLKKKVILGNLTVAVFCAFVAGIVLFAERKGFFQLPTEEFQFVKIIFTAYFVFAFLSTIYREIIKDIEDFKGDLQTDCETLPIKYGISIAKTTALSLGAVLLLLIIWLATLQMSYFNSVKLTIAVVVLNLIPILYSLVSLIKASSKRDYSVSSQLAKYIMISGLLYLLFLI